MATHSNILAWRIPWTEEPGGLQSMESQRVRYDQVTFKSKWAGYSHQAHQRATAWHSKLTSASHASCSGAEAPHSSVSVRVPGRHRSGTSTRIWEGTQSISLRGRASSMGLPGLLRAVIASVCLGKAGKDDRKQTQLCSAPMCRGRAGYYCLLGFRRVA